MEPNALQPRDFAALFLLTVGLGLLLGQFASLLFRLKINTSAMTDAVIKLVREGQVDRAIKLCHVVRHAPYARGLQGALTALQSGATDTLSLTLKFNEALGARSGAQPDFYSSPGPGENPFPALSRLLVRILSRVFLGLGFGAAGAGVHFLSGGGLSFDLFYGAFGAIVFLFLLSLKEIAGIRIRITKEFGRFCKAVQGSPGPSIN